ncbi:putative ribonuclease H-like domain-containing protein [Tanacetum coccineum]
MALPNEHQLKFNTYKSAKTLMETIEKRSSSTNQNIQNVAFVSSNITSSTNEAVKTAHGISAANSKNNDSTLPNVDSLRLECRGRWKMLIMRAKEYFSRVRKESKVEYMAPKNQDSRNRETTRRTVPVKETTSNVLVSHAGVDLGYDSQVFDSQVFDSQMNDKYKSGKRYHDVPPPYTRNLMPPKPDLVLAEKDEYVFSESVTSVPAIVTSEVKTTESKPKFVSEPLIEDWISDNENENEIEFKSRQRKPSNAKVKFVKSIVHLIHLEESIKKVGILRKCNSLEKTSPKLKGNLQQDLKDKWAIVVDLGHMTQANKSILQIMMKINGGFSALEVIPKDGKILGKGICKIELNKEMNQFCEMKGIKREFSVARTPQQSRVAERKNRTLIEAARTMLADSKLPTTFWAEAVNTACYVQNRILVIKPHNKTPYELFHGRTPSLSFMRPFGYAVIILNTLDHLGKFDGKADEGFFVGYSVNSKAFRVFNSRTRIVEETLHITFLENKPNVAGSRPTWLFYIDTLTKSMNYKPVIAENQSNGPKNTKDYAGKKVTEVPKIETGVSSKEDDKDDQDLRNEFESLNGENDVNNTNNINTVSSTVNTTSIKDNVVDENIVYGCADDPNIPNLEEIVYSDDNEDNDAEIDMNNLNTFMPVSPIPTTRLYKDHPLEQIIGDIHSALQTRRMTKSVTEHAEPKKTLVDLPYGKRAIGTKWVYRNKKDKRGIVIKDKARLVTQGYTQEERIYYDEVFAPVSRIEAIRLLLAYASYKDFVVYQMYVKSTFLYGNIKEKVYSYQPLGFKDPEFLDRVYKVENALYGLHQAPRAWYETLSTYLLENGFQRGTVDKTLFIKKVKGDILLVQVYVDDIIFGSTKKVMHKEDGIFISQDKFQVTPKVSHLHARKRILRYLKGQPKLGLWYPKDSPFDLEAYTDSDYVGASLDRKSTTGVAYLDKSTENADFDEIVDILNANPIRYALTIFNSLADISPLDFTESGDSTSIILDPPPFTPFEGSEMLLEEEIEEFLENNEFLNMDLNEDFNDEEGDFKKQINNVESVKTSIEEPPDLELKDLPSHLEYAFLEKDKNYQHNFKGC